MREIVIRNLDDAAVQRLEQRAAASGRSLDEEIHHILTEGVLFMEKATGVLQQMKKTLTSIQPPPQRDANKVREAEEFFKRLGNEERP